MKAIVSEAFISLYDHILDTSLEESYNFLIAVTIQYKSGCYDNIQSQIKTKQIITDFGHLFEIKYNS